MKAMGMLVGLLACLACAEPIDKLDLTDREQAAVVSAVMSIDGFGATNQWILIKADKGDPGITLVRMWTKEALNLSDALATNRMPALYATVDFTDDHAEVHYERRHTGNAEMQTAIRQGVAFLAKMGWLPAGTWISCDRESSGFHLFFWTEPNRWPGDHCSIEVTDTGLRHIGGR